MSVGSAAQNPGHESHPTWERSHTNIPKLFPVRTRGEGQGDRDGAGQGGGEGGGGGEERKREREREREILHTPGNS